MLPKTGPFSATQIVNITGAGYTKKVQSKFKQVRPYSLPLPYWMWCGKVLKMSQSLPSGPQPIDPSFFNSRVALNSTWLTTKPFIVGYGVAPIIQSSVIDVALSKAKARYRNQIMSSAQAELGAAMAERGQAMTMITARLGQMFRFTRAVKKFDWNGAAKELNLDKASRARFMKLKTSDKLRSSSRSFSNNWLEFHFGWSPLVGDIFSAMDVLGSPITPRRVKGSCKVPFDVLTDNRVLQYDSYYQRHKGYARYSMGSEFEVSNPNLLLLNQLGVINPASVLWEVVPWSFVVDWFVNVSDFLEQFGEYAGINRINPWYTLTVEDTVEGIESHGSGATKSTYIWTTHAISIDRKIGDPPSISLNVKPRWNLSPSRGLTAASLLIQQGMGHPITAYPESRVRTTTWPLSTDYFISKRR